MSRLVSRILLTIFMLPAAALVYVIAFAVIEQLHRGNQQKGFLFSGIVAAIFIASYWLLLWHGSVQWDGRRVITTAGAAALAIGVSIVIGFAAEALVGYTGGEFGTFLATVSAPIIWLILTVFLWRETPAERLARLHGSSQSAVVCPSCGYNLTGLSTTRCPECGRQYTLDELLAAQPKFIDADVAN